MKDTRMDTPGTKPRYQTSGQSSRHVRTEDVWAEDVCTENVCTEDVYTEDGGSTGMLKTGADAWAGTGADARAGFDPMEAVDVSLARLASCPLHATRTQAFAVQAGLLFGRMVAIDSRESRDSPGSPDSHGSHGSRAQQPAASDRQQNMRTIQRLCSSWTILDPAASALLLTVVKPEVLYALIIFWPEHLPMSRPFYAAVLLGCYLEQMEGTDFLGENNNSGLLLDIIAESIAAASPDADNDAGAEADAI